MDLFRYLQTFCPAVTQYESHNVELFLCSGCTPTEIYSVIEQCQFSNEPFSIDILKGLPLDVDVMELLGCYESCKTFFDFEPSECNALANRIASGESSVMLHLARLLCRYHEANNDPVKITMFYMDVEATVVPACMAQKQLVADATDRDEGEPEPIILPDSVDQFNNKPADSFSVPPATGPAFSGPLSSIIEPVISSFSVVPPRQPNWDTVGIETTEDPDETCIPNVCDSCRPSPDRVFDTKDMGGGNHHIEDGQSNVLDFFPFPKCKNRYKTTLKRLTTGLQDRVSEQGNIKLMLEKRRRTGYDDNLGAHFDEFGPSPHTKFEPDIRRRFITAFRNGERRPRPGVMGCRQFPQLCSDPTHCASKFQSDEY